LKLVHADLRDNGFSTLQKDFRSGGLKRKLCRFWAPAGPVTEGLPLRRFETKLARTCALQSSWLQKDFRSGGLKPSRALLREAFAQLQKDFRSGGLKLEAVVESAGNVDRYRRTSAQAV